MRERSDPVELIRTNNPVPDAHRLPDESRASFEALLEEIIGMEHQQTGQTRNDRRPRIGRIGVLAATFLILTAGVAVAAGVFHPDPADIATIEDDAAPVAEVHLEGWRPELKTEAVWCMVDSSSGADTLASEFPLTDPMTIEILVAECGTGNDVARNSSTPPADFTVCEATFTSESYEERIRVEDRFNIVGGKLAADRPGFPVVLAWDADCTATHLDTSWEVELRPLSSVDHINLAREVEVGLRAAALRSCLSLGEARGMAAAARAQLGEEWLLLEWDPEVPGQCYAIDVDLQWGTLLAQVRDDGTPAEPDEAAEPRG